MRTHTRLGIAAATALTSLGGVVAIAHAATTVTTTVTPGKGPKVDQTYSASGVPLSTASQIVVTTPSLPAGNYRNQLPHRTGHLSRSQRDMCSSADSLAE